MRYTKAKTTSIRLRIEYSLKRQFEANARLRGMSLSAFLRECAAKQAAAA